jgi:hypothetical protein
MVRSVPVAGPVNVNERARIELAADAVRGQLRSRGHCQLRVRGSSMRPLLPDGAVLRLRAARPGEDLRGAIAAIDANGQVVVHRVTAVRGGTVATRGIASRGLDPPRPLSAIVGIADQLSSPTRPWPWATERGLRVLAAAGAAVFGLRERWRRRRP